MLQLKKRSKYEPQGGSPINPQIARSHQKYEPFAQNGNGSAQSPNPLLKMAAGTPKVRTLCAKWQLERPKYEPCTQNTSWSVEGTTLG